ncbi:MAG: serine/threonine-protein kinase, partial [Maioricimonas sp. JB049]
MALKLTAESFLTGVRQSGLVPTKRLDAALADCTRSGVDMHDAPAIAEALIQRSALTGWQAEKLLQGKFKGFVLGRYRLQNLLGRGEMSSVYLAEHVRMKRRCAIKVLPAARVRDTSYLGRFYREAEAVATLDHPNIVRAYDVDDEVEAGTEIHFLVMEYVEGVSLEKLLEEKREFPIIEAVDYIRQAAEGLAHAHENGLIHRDIKPGNLLINRQGVVKLLDLGLARFFKSEEEESLTIKHDEKVLGTADYLAPEQAVDSHAVDERADIYSLGCTLYFALAGHPPFTDGTLVQRLLAHQTKAPTPITKLRPDVPEGIARILAKMMQKRKEDRFASTRDVADALGRWLTAHGGRAWRLKHPELLARFAEIKRAQAGVSSTPAAGVAAEQSPTRSASRRPEGVPKASPTRRPQRTPAAAPAAVRRTRGTVPAAKRATPTGQRRAAAPAVRKTTPPRAKDSFLRLDSEQWLMLVLLLAG